MLVGGQSNGCTGSHGEGQNSLNPDSRLYAQVRKRAPREAGIRSPKKPPPQGRRPLKKGGGGAGLDLLHQAGLDGLHRDPHALDRAIGQLYADALQVRLKTTFRRLGNVRADSAAFFGDTFAVNDAPGGRAFSSDGTDSRHGFSVIKRIKIKGLGVVAARGISIIVPLGA